MRLKFALDVHGRLTVNDTTSAILGRNTENWDEIWASVHPSDAVRERGNFEIAVAKHTTYHASYRVRCRDGRYHKVYTDMWPVYRYGKVAGFHGEIEVPGLLSADVSISPFAGVVQGSEL
jgi:PAS domain-containing protein